MRKSLRGRARFPSERMKAAVSSSTTSTGSRGGSTKISGARTQREQRAGSDRGNLLSARSVSRRCGRNPGVLWVVTRRVETHNPTAVRRLTCAPAVVETASRTTRAPRWSTVAGCPPSEPETWVLPSSPTRKNASVKKSAPRSAPRRSSGGKLKSASDSRRKKRARNRRKKNASTASSSAIGGNLQDSPSSREFQGQMLPRTPRHNRTPRRAWALGGHNSQASCHRPCAAHSPGGATMRATMQAPWQHLRDTRARPRLQQLRLRLMELRSKTTTRCFA